MIVIIYYITLKFYWEEFIIIFQVNKSRRIKYPWIILSNNNIYSTWYNNLKKQKMNRKLTLIDIDKFYIIKIPPTDVATSIYIYMISISNGVWNNT